MDVSVPKHLTALTRHGPGVEWGGGSVLNQGGGGTRSADFAGRKVKVYLTPPPLPVR